MNRKIQLCYVVECLDGDMCTKEAQDMIVNVCVKSSLLIN